jgi:hypothetical protein
MEVIKIFNTHKSSYFFTLRVNLILDENNTHVFTTDEKISAF